MKKEVEQTSSPPAQSFGLDDEWKNDLGFTFFATYGPAIWRNVSQKKKESENGAGMTCWENENSTN